MRVRARVRDVRGGAVLVEGCHIKVVDEVDELLVAGRAEVLARLVRVRARGRVRVRVRARVRARARARARARGWRFLPAFFSRGDN